MFSKELRKLKREDLLELLIERTKEAEQLKEELTRTQKILAEKEEMSSLAQTSMLLNDMLEAAQSVCKQYMETSKTDSTPMPEEEHEETEVEEKSFEGTEEEPVEEETAEETM